jgi:hypothetical protein
MDKIKQKNRPVQIRFTTAQYNRILAYAKNVRHLLVSTCLKAVILEHLDEFDKKILPKKVER